MLGRATHFHRCTCAGDIDTPHALERCAGEAKKCYEIMNTHSLENAWFGTDFSIADRASKDGA